MLDRLIAGRVLGWTAAAAALVGGMAALAGAVEAARLGAAAAAMMALLQVPAALTLLAPVLAAMGAAVAAARMTALGEALALQSAGISPWRTGAAAAGVGLLIGLLQWGLADGVLWQAEAHRRALLAEEDAPWVWVEGSAIHPTRQLRIELDGSRIVAVRPLQDGEVDAQTLILAAQRQQPQTASGAALRDTTLASAMLERISRRARVLACGLLAWLTWVPLPAARSGARQVGAALCIAVGWQALDLLLYTAAAQGRLSVWVGGLAATAVLLASLGGRLVLSRG